MKAEVLKVTPELAREWLEKNGKNRHVSMQRVSMYAEDMQLGRWQMNGEPICFNKSGMLTNGQHRLRSVIKSGCSVRFLIVRDLDDGVSIYDRGRSRNVTDGLIIGGMPGDLANNTNVAIAKLDLYITEGKKVVSDGEAADYLNKHEKSPLAIHSLPASKAKSPVNTKHACIGTALLRAYEAGVDQNTLVRFVNCLRTGFYGDGEKAAVVLRNDIISQRISPMRGGGGMRAIAVYQVEKAISDFDHNVDRKMSYAGWNKPVYSACKKEKK